MADTGNFYDASEAAILAEVTLGWGGGAFLSRCGVTWSRTGGFTAKELCRVGDRVTFPCRCGAAGRASCEITPDAPGNAALREYSGTPREAVRLPERADRWCLTSHTAPVDHEEKTFFFSRAIERS